MGVFPLPSYNFCLLHNTEPQHGLSKQRQVGHNRRTRRTNHTTKEEISGQPVRRQREQITIKAPEFTPYQTGIIWECSTVLVRSVTDRGLFHSKSCNVQTSVTAGTIFHRTRKPLRLWFEVMWYVTSQKHGVSAKGLAHVLGVERYMTVWTWLHKLRAAMVRPGPERLSGTVEIDEAYIGGPRPGKRGRGAEGKCLVLVAVEDKGRALGRIHLRQVADASAKSLTPAV
jgi:hypothetical protein